MLAPSVTPHAAAYWETQLPRKAPDLHPPGLLLIRQTHPSSRGLADCCLKSLGKQPLVEIDIRGKHLTGCMTCDRLTRST